MLRGRLMKSQNSTNSVYIIGAGGHGQVVLDVLLKSGISPAGFLDDDRALWGKNILGVPVFGGVLEAKKLSGKFIVAIGSNETRKKIVEMLNFPDDRYFTAIHPNAVLGEDVRIGAGAMIIGGVVINVQTKVGRHVIINTASSVDHHNEIGDFVHIAPGSHTGGNVKIEEGSFLGIGVSVIPGVKIGKWSVVGAGATVISDIPAYSVAVGVPASVVKRRQVK